MKTIYILRGEEKQGPFSLSEVFAKLTDGTLSPQDQARREGETEWRTLEEVMKDGASFFSVQQIEQMRAEDPPTPVIIPDFQPSRSIVETEEAERKRGVLIISISACLLLMVLGLVAVQWRTVETSEDATMSASPTPPTIASVMQPAASASPAISERIANHSAPVQPRPDAANSRPTPRPIASQSAPEIEPSPAPSPIIPSGNDSRPVIASTISAKPTPTPPASNVPPIQSAKNPKRTILDMWD